MALEQEKQGKTRKKQIKTEKKQEQVQENKSREKPLTFYDAKREVFDLIQLGKNYRDISQISFQIDDIGLKRFSISEISKIKNEFLGNNSNKSIGSGNLKKDKSEIFKLIKNGMSLEDIVISTRSDPDFVKESYDEYVSLKNALSTTVDNIIRLLAKKGIPCNDPNLLYQILEKIIDGFKFLDILCYKCSICKKPVFLAPHKNKDWREDFFDALDYLSLNHGHREC